LPFSLSTGFREVILKSGKTIKGFIENSAKSCMGNNAGTVSGILKTTGMVVVYQIWRKIARITC